jgi:L-aminopeptidase/D-esterase-like protein
MAPRPDQPAAEFDPVLPVGSITDVAGVRVGHHQRTGRGWQTGTTVVFVPDGATPGVSVRGGGPGTRETDALRPENLVQEIHAVCLTGGSAFGLAAADGVVAWLEEQRLGFPVGPPDDPQGVVPVVPAAVVFDLGAPDGSTIVRPPSSVAERSHRHGSGSVRGGRSAPAPAPERAVCRAVSARRAPRSRFPSRRRRSNRESTTLLVQVGAVAVVNANGTASRPRDRAAMGPEPVRAGERHRPRTSASRRRLAGQGADLNTTIGVVATSASLTKSEVSKMADVAHDGLARAIRPAHSMFDGDTIFGLATGDHDIGDLPAGMRSTPSRQSALNLVLRAAADTFAAASAHAVLAATTVGDSGDPQVARAYVDLCPSALRRPRGRTTSAH